MVGRMSCKHLVLLTVYIRPSAVEHVPYNLGLLGNLQRHVVGPVHKQPGRLQHIRPPEILCQCPASSNAGVTARERTCQGNGHSKRSGQQARTACQR
jgi:hypothetical protein